MPRGKFKILIASLLSSAPFIHLSQHCPQSQAWLVAAIEIQNILFIINNFIWIVFHWDVLFPSFPSPALLKIYIRWKCESPRGWKSHYRASRRQKSSNLEPTGSSQRSFVFTGDSRQDWAVMFPLSLGLKTEDAACFLSKNTLYLWKWYLKKAQCCCCSQWGPFLIFVLYVFFAVGAL